MRTALQALSAVLGGTNSLHTNSLDEALALPTEEAATLALRTQQILAHETGVADVVDPLGGSYFVERLTRDLEDEARAVLRHDRRHGRHGRGDRARVPAARDRRERVSVSAGRRARASRSIVGVNEFASEDDAGVADRCRSTRRAGAAAAGQGSSACAARATRSRSTRALDRLRKAAARHGRTRCRRCSTPSARMRRSARCVTRCGMSGASTQEQADNLS